MKFTVVDESLSSTELQFCSRENQLATRKLSVQNKFESFFEVKADSSRKEVMVNVDKCNTTVDTAVRSSVTTLAEKCMVNLFLSLSITAHPFHAVGYEYADKDYRYFYVCSCKTAPIVCCHCHLTFQCYVDPGSTYSHHDFGLGRCSYLQVTNDVISAHAILKAINYVYHHQRKYLVERIIQ